MISLAVLLNALISAEKVLQQLGLSSALSVRDCISRLDSTEQVVSTTVVFLTPQIIVADQDDDVYCTADEDRTQARLREAEGAKDLLLAIIKRAAEDWALYRDAEAPDRQRLAIEAYTWLFEEDETHPDFYVRKAEGKELTGFLAICAELGMDAQRIRSSIRRLTPRVVSGRPAQPKDNYSPPGRKQLSPQFVDIDTLDI